MGVCANSCALDQVGSARAAERDLHGQLERTGFLGADPSEDHLVLVEQRIGALEHGPHPVSGHRAHVLDHRPDADGFARRQAPVSVDGQAGAQDGLGAAWPGLSSAPVDSLLLRARS